MPYTYQGGNYTAGDYYSYQAGGLFGSIFGAIGGAAKGLVTGGVTGAIGGAVKGAFGQKSKGTAVTVATKAREVPAPQGVLQVPTQGPLAAAQRFFPGGASGMTTLGGQYMPGYHVNKALMRYARALQMGGQRTDPRSRPRVVNEMVRNRSMNPANPRALRRAIRREAAFVALARRTLKGSGYTIKRTGVAKRRTTRRKAA